jgi:hypothetical protein
MDDLWTINGIINGNLQELLMSMKLVEVDNRLEFDTKIINQNKLNSFLDTVKPFFEKNIGMEKYNNIHNNLNNKEFKIAVVANMSSGKSTFVNSLFGEYILPSFNEATTDCPTYIHSGLKEKKLVVNFEDDKESVELNENIVSEIKKYARKDSPDMSLDYMNVKDIHLYYDFLNLKNCEDLNFKFTFIDTAGPNNKGDFSKKHQDFTSDVILKEADFVIFLFDYGQLDANLDSDSLGLWSLIKQRKANDEFFDVLFLINKLDMAIDDNEADDKPRGYFEKKAIDKLEYFAMTRHGFSEPKVLGVSSSYAFLSRVDISSDKSLSRKYKKILVDFEEINEESPKDEVIKYSNIENVESVILEYINHSIQKVIVDKTKSEILEAINSIYEDIKTQENTLSEKLKEYKSEISRIREFENGDFYKIISNMRRDINLLFNKTINRKKEDIIKLFDTSIQSDIDKVIYESMKNSFDNIIENKEIKTDKKTINIDYKKDVSPNKVREKFVESFNWLVKRREIEFINQYKELLLKDDSKEFVDSANKVIANGINELSKVLGTSIGVNNSIRNFSFFDLIPIELHKELNLKHNHISVMVIREVKQIKDSYVVQNRIEENGYKVETRFQQNGVDKVLRKIDKMYTVENIPKYESVEVKVPQYRVRQEKVYQYKTQIEDVYRVTLYLEAMKKHIQTVSYDGKLEFIKNFESNLRKRFAKTTENIFKAFEEIENEFQGDLGEIKKEFESARSGLVSLKSKKKEIFKVLNIA